jgi:Skp family chaperone for outer membrane proteins
MDRRLILALATTLALAFASMPILWAQYLAPAAWSQTGTALVDVGALTRNSARLKQSLATLKQQHDATAESFKQESQRGNQLGEQLKKLPANSPEYKRLEQQLVKMRADFELRGKRVTAETQDKEAKLYYAFAREMQAEVARLAQSAGLRLVLRYDPPPQELTDPRDVMMEIQKLIVYQRGLEATPTVMEQMNRGAGAPATANRAAAPPGQPLPNGPLQR